MRSYAVVSLTVNGQQFNGQGDPDEVLRNLREFIEVAISTPAKRSPPRGGKKLRTPKKPKA